MLPNFIFSPNQILASGFLLDDIRVEVQSKTMLLLVLRPRRYHILSSIHERKVFASLMKGGRERKGMRDIVKGEQSQFLNCRERKHQE